MASNDETIAGGRELDDLLRTLAPNIHKNIMRAALRAGANEIKDGAKAGVPVKTGNLRKSLGVTTGSKGGVVTAKLKARGKLAPYATLVEFGTRPHKIKPKKKGGLTVGGNIVAEVDHPGARPRPFMRPAFDSKAAPAVAAVAAKIRERLTKEGISTPAPEARE
jgi:HK97 gp10 family phage protein